MGRTPGSTPPEAIAERLITYRVATLCSLVFGLFVTACASAPPPTEEVRPSERAPETETLPPPGYGTLRQDDFTVAFQSGDVQIKVTPLEEAVIRLSAPDTYQRLHGLVTSRLDRIQEISRNAGLRGEPRLFLVSFFTYARQAQFTPTDVQILSQGILYRPIDMLPLTPGWGREQLKQEETQSAVYLFDPSIDVDVVFRVEYAGAGTVAWGQILRVLEAERARVVSRANS